MGDYKNLHSEARSLMNILGDIADKYDKIPNTKRDQFAAVYEPCVQILDELDKLLVHYNGLDTKSKRAWDRLKYDPERTRALRTQLASSVVLLNTFYTSLIHDNQVMILEALERLEKDYKGGHREESIASLEKIASDTVQDDVEDEDAAWSQILRDLEDVGVSQQEAMRYRDFIIDWLVTAVNEGRLVEQRSDLDTLPAPSKELDDTVASINRKKARTHDSEVPRVLPAVERTQSVSCTKSAPMLSSISPSERSGTRQTSTVSLPVSVRSSTSMNTSTSYETDASSLHTRLIPSSSTKAEFDVQRVAIPHRELYEEEVAAMLPFMPPEVPSTLDISHESALEPLHSLPDLAVSVPERVLDSTPEVSQSGYNQRDTSFATDLDWTAHQIIAAWDRRDFPAAERHLEDQLAAVEHGHTVASGVQPERRILRHLLGVCTSFMGNFTKAKSLFQDVFNGIFLNGGNLDEGDIAAARWLGDVCLHLREHHNALLAYSVVFEGCVGRFGIGRDVTSRVSAELKLLDHWLYAFKRIENSFELNVDPTDIFTSTHAVEKSNLILSVKKRLYDRFYSGEKRCQPPAGQYAMPTMQLGARPKFELKIAEGFLLGPLISLSTWPYPWDPTFSPMDIVQIDRNMNSMRITRSITPLFERQIPTISLGDSKKLHYITKRGRAWLIETVKQGLRDLGIEHAEHPLTTTIVCCLNQHHNGFAFFQSLEICFRKLQFRSIYGIQITNVKWATRQFTPSASSDTSDFRNLIKGILQKVDSEPDAV